jgi:hypothetical protein
MSANDFPAPAKRLNWIVSVLLWLVIALAAFTFPRPPELKLDASWRMTMGYAYVHGLQMGTDLVFTYGPLGFVMGKTYWGQLFWEMIAFQAFQATLAAWLFVSVGRRLSLLPRIAFFAFAVLFGVVYEDALEMIVIVLLGWRLVRKADKDKPRAGWCITALLALYGAVKFTNLLLAGFAVAIAVALALYRRAPRVAMRVAAVFVVSTVAIWLLCGQNPLNIPAYLVASLEVSSGYNNTMSLPTPQAPFVSALAVAGLLILALALNIRASERRPRAVALTALFAAFLFLNWKHGFVRADGHMIGFFICALLPITAFPRLLGAANRWIAFLVLLPAGLLAVRGIDQALPGMPRGLFAQQRNRVCDNIRSFAHWQEFRDGLRAKMHEQRVQNDLHEVRDRIGDATIDVLGYEQAIALFNKFNYRPRPVFQSYSAYNAPLARRNLAYYDSAAAPAYALLKIETIDDRLATMDDPFLLNYFLHAYDYVLEEKGWQLWRRRADAPAAERVAPRRLRTLSATVGQSVDLGELSGQPIWVTIDLKPTLLGRIRDFVYKQPLAFLVVEDTAGATSRFRFPPDAGRAGFMLNPLVENIADYVDFGGGQSARRVARLSIEIEEGRNFFKPQAEIGLFALAPSDAALRRQNTLERARLAALGEIPAAIKAFAAPNEGHIDGRPVLVAHAPSRIEYSVPAGATTISGSFGFLPGAYEGDARTNGAEFRVVAADGPVERVLFTRYLDPRNTPADRGLQTFTAPLSSVVDGRVTLVIDAGPGGDNSWDWTAWRGITIR